MESIKNLGLGNVKTRMIGEFTVRYLEKGSGWRFDTLLEKEPETIEWIDGFLPGETLWDIGANVGIYSIYAAMRGMKIVAFEPHFANYFQLCVNIMLNNLQEKIIPLCLAFFHQKEVNRIHLPRVDFGTSGSSFGNNFDFRGLPYNSVFQQGMVAYNIDSFIEDFKVSVPSHIKIDVDGLELNIVKGALSTLSNACVRSISIELIDSDKEQVTQVTELLSQAGLRFIHKKQNPEFANPITRDVLNFLYRRC